MRGGTNRRQAGRLRRRIGVALALLFTLRALVPTGFMLSPEALADGLVRMTLCDGYATRSVLVDADGNIVEDHGETDLAGQHCDFATASLAATPTPPLLLPAPSVLRADALLVPAVADFARPQVRGPPLGSRAPPRSRA